MGRTNISMAVITVNSHMMEISVWTDLDVYKRQNDELAAVQKQLTSAQELLQNCSDKKKAADEDYDEAVKKNKLNGQQTLEAKQQLDEKMCIRDRST